MRTRRAVLGRRGRSCRIQSSPLVANQMEIVVQKEDTVARGVPLEMNLTMLAIESV